MPTKTKPAAEPKPELSYSLDMYDSCNPPREHFDLTAEQYESLKAHLIAMKAPKSYQARANTATERANVINNLLGGDLSGIELARLETVRLMGERDGCGIDDPMSKFILHLIFHYGNDDAEGRGLTLEYVEGALEELRENMSEALSEAQFISSRYPKPEASNA